MFPSESPSLAHQNDEKNTIYIRRSHQGLGKTPKYIFSFYDKDVEHSSIIIEEKNLDDKLTELLNSGYQPPKEVRKKDFSWY